LIDSHFSFQPCLTCLQLTSVVVFALVAPAKLRARTPPRGVRPLHTRRTASDAELLAPARVGGFQRRPCRRVAGGDGGGLVGETSLLRRASVLAFSHSCASRSFALPVALRRQPSYRHLSSVHHSRGGGSAEEPQPLRQFKDGVVVLIFPASAVHLFEAVKTSSTAFDKLDSLGDQRRREAQRISA
jgi:hypothetical protein